MSDADRFRVAAHEAGHSLGRWLYGWPILAVSIRPGRGHVGITLVDRPPGADVRHLIGTAHPLDGLPAEARTFAERTLLTMLLGDAAEALVPRANGYEVDFLPSELAVVQPLPLAAARRLAEAEGRGEDETQEDAALALRMAIRLVGPETALPFLGWMRAEAHRVARDHAGAISAAAHRLVAATVLSGETIAGIFAEAQKGASNGEGP